MSETHDRTASGAPPAPRTPSSAQLAGFANALAGRYAIERELGRGGMATVYLARDERHGRPVALKVLRAEVGAELGAERFLEEIRTTAALQHPHILPLLDSGEADGSLFYVMPYVDGETLRARLDREGSLPVPEAVGLGAQLAAALDCANARGVVHRDVKPENVLLAHGLPVLADFGIAWAAHRARDERLTRTGMSLGTPAYMSPEQVTGEESLDGRADVYSLGCVLYEMLAGRPPFHGGTQHATMIEHLTAPVPPLASPRGAVPARVERAVRRALAKDPAERFATAGEMAAALTASLAGPPTGAHVGTSVEDASIVVRPFENLSPDPDNAFFADGLTEEIIADLAKVRALRVISRATAMRLRGADRDDRAVARELGVRYVLGGSVRRAGNALRVTVQLIDAVADAPLWAEKYAGTLDDVFTIQERLSREIVEALRVTLAPDEARRVGAARVRDPAAYDCFLRARQLLFGGTPESFAAARALLDRAVAISGETPMVLASLAFHEMMLVQCGIDPDPAHYAAALDYAERAIRLEPECAEAYGIVGFVHKACGAMPEAARAFRRALAAEPNHVDALGWFSFVVAECGRIPEARALTARLATTSPYEPLIGMWEGVIDFFDGRFDDALADFAAWEQADPANSWIPFWKLFTLLALDRREEVAALLPRVPQLFAPELGMALASIVGRRLEVAAPVLAGLPEELLAALRGDTELSWFVASSLAHTGEREAAVEWLRNAVRLGLASYPFLAHHDRHLAALRGYPPYDALLAEVEASWRSMEV